ncbi:PREDICTED: uncharacterized protein LOC105557227 [Vollenhovia emeryi]|uniref:uncharacterized protein LOC105557227 n=1 Tax=Vollenhovia emeryi TaxID=411798 RepID=UPI0005F3657E|nr:PREDICTED: uncharacterized protein LOC105557227 [Vollenhovia emeryi]
MTNESVYLYQLIEFVDYISKDGKKSIDCVPTNWVEFDLCLGKCFAKFMPPPYDSERKKELEKMIFDRQDPPDDWPRYLVTIRGGAATYEEAIQRIQRLTVEEFAFTSGCEEPMKKAEIITQSLANKAKGRDEKINEIVNVPSFQTKAITCVSLHLSN